MAKSNFFKELAYLEKRVILENKKETDLGVTSFSETTFQNLSSFIRFIESGKWTRSEHMKFIGRHYKYPQSELPDLYLSATGKRKSASTFRNQHQKASDDLYAYFGKDFMQAFLQEDEKAMQEIINKTAVLSVGDVYFEDLFGNEIAEFIVSKSDGLQRYNLNECEDEINALIALSKTNIDNILCGLDVDKLNYIMSLFRRPLVEQGVLNKEKLSILTSYSDIISNSKVIDYRIKSNRGIEYDEVIFGDDSEKGVEDKAMFDSESDQEREGVDDSLLYSRQVTTQYGDISFPTAFADVLDLLTEGVEEKKPELEDYEEILTITYLIHFYQMHFINDFLSEYDQSLIKYVCNKLKKQNDDGSIFTDYAESDKVYKMLDGYDIMNKEFNIVASRILNSLYKRNEKAEEAFDSLCEKYHLEGYKRSVLVSYFKDNDNTYKEDAEAIVKEHGLSNEDISVIRNSVISDADTDKLILQIAMSFLSRHVDNKEVVSFVSQFLK